MAVIVRGPRQREIYNLPVNLFNFPVKQEKRCINPPLRAGGDRVRVRVTLYRGGQKNSPPPRPVIVTMVYTVDTIMQMRTGTKQRSDDRTRT